MEAMTRRRLHSHAKAMLEMFPDIKGFSFGECVQTGRTTKRAYAHAHIKRGGKEYAGWICWFRGELTYDEDGATPSQTTLHELAHIQTNAGHTPKWKRHYGRLLEEHDYESVHVKSAYHRAGDIQSCERTGVHAFNRVYDGGLRGVRVSRTRKPRQTRKQRRQRKQQHVHTPAQVGQLIYCTVCKQHLMEGTR